MSDSPPSPSPQPPQNPPQYSNEPDTPNPNPENPSQIPHPLTPDIQITIDQQTQPKEEETQNQQQPDDPDPEPEPDNPEPEGPMDITLSPISSETLAHETKLFKGTTATNNPPNSSVRRTAKRKKGTKNRIGQAALERKLHQLSQGFKPIPFIPGKSLDFAKHEVLLKKLGLWDFAHVEFDRHIRVDLVKNLIIEYNVNKRGSYVSGSKIGVSRADLARALKLPIHKKVECDVETFPAEFLSFLDEFVSKWMLLHEDPWCTPPEIVNMMKLIKDGNLYKVDWAGMIWYMMEKELSQKAGLKECYYASHLQHLVKVQKEELFRESLNLELGSPKAGVESSKETVAVEDDDEDEDDGGDVKMLDVEESGSVGQQKVEEQNIELRLGQDSVGDVKNVVDAEEVEKDDGDYNAHDVAEKVEDVEKEKDDHDIGKFEDISKEKDEHDITKFVDFSEEKEEHDIMKFEDLSKEKEEHDTAKFEDASKDKEEHDVSVFEDVGKEKYEHDICNSESVDEGKKMEGIETSEFVENVDNVENMEEENKDEEMTDYGDYKEEQLGQGQWLFDGNIEGKPFLQRCSMDEVNVTRRFEDVCEDVEDDEVEEDGHVEGFKIMQKNPLDGMTSANLMQALETGQLPFPSNELGGQSSLELMTTRADNNMMLGGPSMFNHSGKREIDHEIEALDDGHKRMRVDGNWDNKAPDFDVCIGQLQQWIEKSKMSHIAATQEAYQQVSITQNFYTEQLLGKENEIAQLRYKYEELNKRKQEEIDRLNKDLYLMNSVIDGYRRALKQTQRTFSEYRQRCQVPDEPIYKDAGPGGVVKSVMELERERLKQEEENKRMRNFMEEMIMNFVDEFEVKCSDKILAKVEYHNSRLSNAVKEMELLKDHLTKKKQPANVQNEPGAPSE